MAVSSSAAVTVGVTLQTPASYSASDFSKLTYASLGEVTDISDIDTEFTAITHTSLSNRRIAKLKGSYQYGEIEFTAGRNISDAGQSVIASALSNDQPVSLKIALTPTDSIYLTGFISAYRFKIGLADQVLGVTFSITATSPVLSEDLPPIGVPSLNLDFGTGQYSVYFTETPM